MSSTTPARVYNGRYELVRHIARGGMAEVYQARDLLLDRPVALKVLFPELSVDRSFVERFRREAQAAANLTHQNIVSIYDWGEEDGTYFIVMEYVDGRPLSDILRREGRFTAERAAAIGTQVAAALGNAHRHGVVHRDIKPGNILLDPNGLVKVTDFGIARAGDTSENLTQTGAVMGTATYFSPEQAQGLDVDARTDLYSLGVVLFELVTGKPPFSGETPLAIAYKHVKEQIPPPSTLEPSVPAGLEAIILTAVEKNRSDRFPGADELRGDLLRFSRGQTPIALKRRQAIAAGALAPSARPATPPPPASDATQVMPVAPTVVAPVATTPVTPATPTPTATPVAELEDEHKARTGVWIGTSLALLVVLAILLFLLARTVGLVGSDTSSTAKPEVAIVDVAGKAQEEAKATLEALKFQVSFVDGADATKAAGIVIGQNPAGGTKADEGSVVTLTINRAEAGVDVPSVTNLKADEAKATLQAAGFTVETAEQRSDTVSEGFVLSQNPAARSQQPKGSTVTITVSTGKDLPAVPDVTGLTQAEAVNQLSEAGYTVKIVSETSNTVPSGSATRTDPVAGTKPKAGNTKVTLYVSSGTTSTTAGKVSVPNVKGQAVADAKQAIIDAGFVPSVVGSGSVVVGQNPAGGTMATKGSTVVLTTGAASTTTSTTTKATTTTSTTTLFP